MAVDLVIKNCKIVYPWGTIAAGIAIQGEKIVAIASDDNLPESDRTIDALENYVIPGVIDTHVHLGPIPSLERVTKVDTVGAAIGGVTTLGNFIGGRAWFDTTSYTGKFEQWKEIYEKHAVVDSFCHMFIALDVHLRELVANAIRYGMFSCKFHTGYRETDPNKIELQDADYGFLYSAFKDVASLGYPARAMVHAENAGIINRIRPAIEKLGRNDLKAWAESRPPICELVAVEQCINIAKVTGVPLYIVHTSTAASVDAIAQAKADGVDVVAETCPQYLTLTADTILGSLGKTNPPFRDKESIQRLWRGINDGTIECIGTDHCTHSREMKKDIWSAPPGIPGIEYLLCLVLSEGVNKGRITIEKLVEVCCYNNAKVFGLYPRKGIINVGSDADLVIIDLDKKVKLSVKASHQLSDFCPYEGWEIKGFPLLTMVRGHIVAKDGKLVAKPGFGKYIRRPLK